MPGFLILKERYVLRGWKGLKCGITDTLSGKTSFLPLNVFDTLRLCNGKFEKDNPLFVGKRKEHLKEFFRCGLIEERDTPGSLLPEQAYKEYDNRYIYMLHWSMTGHCNYRCRHCYMSAPKAVLPEPDTAECKRIIDDIVSCGIRLVSLTGGEVLTRDDFLILLDYMLERGLRIETIMSNGALVNEKLLKELKKRDCMPEFNMSYDGADGWHDWLRGVDGAEASVGRAFSLCREYGFSTGSEFCLHRGNAGTLRESIIKLGEWGVSSLKVSRLCASGEALNISDKHISCEEEYRIYYDYIPRYLEDGMPVKNLLLSGMFGCRNGNPFIPGIKGDDASPDNKRYVCNSARLTMYLGPDGRILPCIPMSETVRSQEYFPKIEGMKIKEALTNSTYLSFICTDMEQYLAHNTECASCEYKYRCGGGCRGRAVMDCNGEDLLAPDPDACLFFKGGWYERVNTLMQLFG